MLQRAAAFLTINLFQYLPLAILLVSQSSRETQGDGTTAALFSAITDSSAIRRLPRAQTAEVWACRHLVSHPSIGIPFFFQHFEHSTDESRQTITRSLHLSAEPPCSTQRTNFIGPDSIHTRPSSSLRHKFPAAQDSESRPSFAFGSPQATAAMAAAIAAVPSDGSSAGKPDKAGAPPSKTPSVTTSLSQGSPSPMPTPTSAASPSNVPTPASSGSTGHPPIAIRPSTANKPLAPQAPGMMNGTAAPGTGTPAPGPQPRTLSMTSKEWVIPPRPKPGRKPATDTPPTKRKAQNRAAQRAFRERRAARVGELEEQLEEEKAAHERAVRELQERISHLEIETQTLQSRCQWLESMLEKERQDRGGMPRAWDNPQVSTAAARSNNAVPSPTLPQLASAGLPRGMRPLRPGPPKNTMPSPVTIAEPRPIAQPFSISRIVSPPEETAEAVDLTCGRCQATGSCACAEEVLQNAEIPLVCGKCSLGTRCECLETLTASIPAPDLKRPLPPSSPPSTSPEEKRQRADDGLALETDFTAMFASQGNKDSASSALPPSTQSQLQPLMSLDPRDPCGFCKEGTYCICADSMVGPIPAVSSASQQAAEQTQTRTPPPSENDVVPTPMEVTATGAIKLPSLRSLQGGRPSSAAQSTPPARTGGCGVNGPGTCAQCLADPKSGLFCRSLAANFEKSNPGSSAGGGGCCGGGGPGGCCKAGQSDTAAPGAPRAGSSSDLGLSLSCADAYKTLASHRHFDEAADDIGSWLPKLKALPIPRPSDAARGRDGRGHCSGGRAPIEVEAASIMSVLKDFDIRFGRGE